MTKPVLLGNYASEHQQNLAIEEFVRSKIANPALSVSNDEKEILLRYTGRGQAFNKNIEISSDAGLFEFYTPDYIRELMWKLAYYYGYDGGPILEPSCATGHMFLNAPITAEKVGFEVNPITAQIAQICFSGAKIYNQYFETAFLQQPLYRSALKKQLTWLKEYPFSLVIGNPPYGEFITDYPYFKNPNKGNFYQIEIFFLYKCLELLKPGGVLVFLTASSWLRSGSKYQPMKEAVTKIATLVDAYRTGEVFKHTGVPTDILVYKKHV